MDDSSPPSSSITPMESNGNGTTPSGNGTSKHSKRCASASSEQETSPKKLRTGSNGDDESTTDTESSSGTSTTTSSPSATSAVTVREHNYHSGNGTIVQYATNSRRAGNDVATNHHHRGYRGLSNEGQQHTSTCQIVQGCGCGPLRGNSPDRDDITITITPTTGGQFDVTVGSHETVENLKKSISKRLKVAKERICLLHRER